MAYLLTVASFTILLVMWIALGELFDEITRRQRESERRRGAVEHTRGKVICD